MKEKKQIEATGKSIDEAIEAALKELNVDRDQVEIEILQTPKKGLFGLNNTPAKVLATIKDDAVMRTIEFLEDLFKHMNMQVNIDITEKEDEILVNLSGPKMGVLIGRRGETLDAIQYLTRLAVNKGGEDYKKISIDTENYREKRAATLRRLTQRLSEKVIRTKKNISLEPMNSYERKIIHAALQSNPRVSTMSVGEEPNRKVIISYKRTEDE
jgi:spoIIIJ-associated protein